jgi:uncharacterized damage-inducible protein DinB
MSMVQPLLTEFEYECMQTRKLLERVPDGAWDFKPHEKSMSLQQLAGHIAEIPVWVDATCNLDLFTMDPGSYTPFLPASTQDLLDTFDANVSNAILHLRRETDEHLLQQWMMKMGDRIIVNQPRFVVLRSFIISHTIHHRGQLTVYLRMQDVPLPSIYGPTADDPGSM